MGSRHLIPSPFPSSNVSSEKMIARITGERNLHFIYRHLENTFCISIHSYIQTHKTRKDFDRPSSQYKQLPTFFFKITREWYSITFQTVIFLIEELSIFFFYFFPFLIFVGTQLVYIFMEYPRLSIFYSSCTTATIL